MQNNCSCCGQPIPVHQKKTRKKFFRVCLEVPEHMYPQVYWGEEERHLAEAKAASLAALYNCDVFVLEATKFVRCNVETKIERTKWQETK